MPTAPDAPVLVLEGDAVADVEDGGKAMILYIGEQYPDEDDEVFVRVQSWSEGSDHSALDAFVGKRLRVTVEVVSADAP
jgi:hypothetical protein